jgi:hypothetical protein
MKNKLGWTFLSVLLVACGDLADGVATRTQPLVFDKREALQSRVGMLSSGYDVASKECQREFQHAMLVGGTASIVKRDQSSGCGLQIGSSYFGSGMLVSPSTMLTAAHVAEGTNETRFVVHFGTYLLNGQHVNEWGPDDIEAGQTGYNNWVFNLGLDPGDESPLLTNNDFDRWEESPLLAERLFQISFHGAAFDTGSDPSRTVDGRPFRNALTNDWPFRRVANWWLLAKDNHRDLAYLMAEDRGPALAEALVPLALGPVDLSQPGLFFNFAGVREYEIPSIVKPWATLLHAQSLNQKPQDATFPMYTPGRLDRELFDKYNNDGPSVCYSEGNGGVKTTTIAKHARPKGEFDAFNGSSGGALVACDQPECGRYAGDGTYVPDVYAEEFVRGVASTVFVAGLDLSDPDNPYNTWGRPVKPNDGSYTAFELLTPADFLPEPDVVTCDSRPNVQCAEPLCVVTASDGYCDTFSGGQYRTNELGAPPTDDSELAPPKSDGEVRLRDDTQASRVFGLNCNRYMHNIDGHSHNGAVVGIRGFPGQVSGSGTRGIGSFEAVCGPLDIISWVDNWSWLRAYGPSSPIDVDPEGTYGRSPLFPNNFTLFRALNTEFYRQPGPDSERPISRPMPMKLCPPNHLLNGFNVTQSTDGARIERIDSLICSPQHSSAANLMEVPLWIPEESRQGYEYTVAGEPYSLSQEIGNQIARGRQIKISCPLFEVAYKIQVAYNDAQQLSGLWLACTSEPLSYQ